MEKSSGFQIGCFKFENYPQLRSQFDASHFNIWNNRWSQMFDFSQNVEKNCDFISEDVTAAGLMGKLLCKNRFLTAAEVEEGGFLESSDPLPTRALVPVTTGIMEKQ